MEYAKKKYAGFQQRQRQLIFRRRRLAVVFVGALVIFAIIGARIFHDTRRMHQLNELKVEANTEMREVNADADQLHQDVLLLKGDEYVAKLVRGKFLHSRDDEKAYPILESNTNSSTNKADQSANSTTTK